jgi:prolyl 4-hydroxylase
MLSARMALNRLETYVRTYDNALSPALCRQMIDSFHALARFQKTNGRGVRAGLEQSGWTELNVTRFSDEAFLTMFRGFIDAALLRYNEDLGLTIPIPNSPKLGDLTMKRYRPGHEEQFQVHFDAVGHMATRFLVLLWYLNDVDEGGETVFPQLNLKVEARAGRLAVFPPYWMFQHEGAPPRSGDKYILSTYLMFEQPNQAS